MSSRRPHNWPDWLHLYLNGKFKSPFAWGENDCCLFSADWIRLMIGEDLAADLRGTYSTAEQAEFQLLPSGGLESHCVDKFKAAGLKEISLAYAQRGDVVMAKPSGNLTLGIVVDDNAAFVHLVRGLVYIPTEQCYRAWRVD